METYPWWSEAHIKLAEDARRFTDEVLIPIGERDALLKKFSREGLKQMATKGWFGALVPRKYGGHAEEWGVTGAAIITEEASRAGEAAGGLGTTMFGSATQIVHNGTEEQKQKWLPKICKGELIGCYHHDRALCRVGYRRYRKHGRPRGRPLYHQRQEALSDHRRGCRPLHVLLPHQKQA